MRTGAGVTGIVVSIRGSVARVYSFAEAASPGGLDRGDKGAVQRRRFTAEEYHKMAEAGILHEDDRVELIEGDIESR